jgi:type I restriction enzyme M protein
VEDFLILPLLKYLGYQNEDIRTKQSIEEIVVSKKGGRKKEPYKPDFVLVLKDEPRVVIDAKATDVNIDEFTYQCRAYCLSLNLKFQKQKPTQCFILSNGRVTKLYQWDEEKPLVLLSFDDFADKNQRFEKLVNLVSKSSILQHVAVQPSTGKVFDYSRPDLADLPGIFTACHNLIWKKEKIGPTEAFYKFAKIMFIKLKEDKRIRSNETLKPLLTAKQPIPIDEVVFSVDWIEKREKEGVKNPFDTILFLNLRQQLETEVKKGIKKRIFEQAEQIDLKASTIKEVVRLLEHHDLYGIDEDLNGRLFENFLEATVRGRELGQFFTPRSVVQFMTQMANLRVDFEKESFDRTLDACCGTCGFLIEAMAILRQKIDENQSLSLLQKTSLKDKLVKDYLFGIDASKTITRIARINMYLHGDGGSRIYEADSLDKNITIEKGIEDEWKSDLEELKERLIEKKQKFTVVLTNPPFAMRYERKKADEKQILDRYSLAYDDSGVPRASLKSSVMFLERYCDLLEPHGKLLTVMDESVLNTSSNKPFRDYIKKHFLVKAVISLPQNTFVNAGSAVKTSVLYLVKKEKEDEPQPKTFMAISENVGHLDSGRRSPKLNDLPLILEEFRRFEQGK